jgi:hypothetical protein
MNLLKFKNLPFFATALLLALGAAGCNWLGPAMSFMELEKEKKVTAEYNELAGKKVCIWVWADESLVFEYPAVRVDTANWAKYYIKQNVEKVDFVDPIRVYKFQESNYEADAMPVVEVGQKFEADMVLFIQVSDFTTRPPSSPNLFQGHMNAQCALYNCKGELPVESPKRKLWDGKIDIEFPDHPVSIMESNDVKMRSALLGMFGESLARKFYDYKVKVGDM